MTWTSALNNPNLIILTGPILTLESLDLRPIVVVDAGTPLGSIEAIANNPLTSPFLKTIEGGRPVDAGGSGSVRPASGLVYPRKV
jgi:hypothetical protein